MRKINYLITLLFVSVFSTVSVAQKFKLDVHIDNLEDSTIYLGYYFGDKQFAKDTITLDSKGNGTFTNEELIPKGMYFILTPKNLFFEVIIDTDQTFSVSTTYSSDPSSLNSNLTSKGSHDMELYINYQNFMKKQGDIAMPLRNSLKDEKDDVKKQQTIDKLQQLHNEVKEYWNKIETDHPNSMLASILLLNKDIEIPEAPKNENGEPIDPNFQYNYYKAHYFDYIDFSDERILRTQFYHPKLERYFEKLIVPSPDTVIKESKMVLKMASANEEVYKYTLQHLFNKYNNSQIMGMDKAFVFFAENYYLNGNAEWADTAWLRKVEERVNDIKPNILGNKSAEIKLLTPDDQFFSLHTLNAEYTILFFYEPGCGHCKKATPKMKKLSEYYWEKGVEVIAIYTQIDKEEWTKYIKDHELENWNNGWDPYNQSNYRKFYDIKSTPSIYLIDKKKNIIAKRIDTETLEKILRDKLNVTDDPLFGDNTEEK